MKFVNSVLLRRENCGIQKFSLRFSGYYCTSIHVNEWILSAVDHNVRELSISFYASKTFELPSFIFTCRSLTALTLYLNCSTLNVPSSIHLPFLKTLHLTAVAFSDDSLPLFSNCPILENDYLTFNDVVHDFVIRVSALSLLTLEYKDYRVQNICLEHMSSLKNAFIDLNFDWNGKERICRHRVGILLRGLSNVEFLKISSAIIKHLFDTKESLETQNSECLVDNLKIINIRSFTGNEQEIIFVKYLLMRACALERIIIVCLKQFSINLELQTEIGDGILLHPRGSPDSEVTFVTMR
ncbi:hypothetical protein IFM89_035732 [Coptis chinensis]|uniref:FBD domain-containing protein n=1 Tax=Coptis chinensis TaxID=261450 RepID=A0A835H2S6_9MAGN|nr:hypothetical protein IFM89_035732 [Coptis chinensis]